MTDAQIVADRLDSALFAFRSAVFASRDWGMKLTAELPPMSHADAARAEALAAEAYYDNPRARGDAELRSLTLAAIDAATIHNGAKPTKCERLHRLLIERDGPDCWFCHHDATDNATIEHKIALANGGTWALDNLVRAHLECNRAVGRLPVEAKQAVRDLAKGAGFPALLSKVRAQAGDRKRNGGV